MDYMVETGLDQATADLIIQLQLQDISLYSESSKGKSREPTDEELAFRLQNEELENNSQLLLDRRMAMSFAAAVLADGSLLADTYAEEQRVARDREMARQLTDTGEHPVTANVCQQGPEPSTGLDDEILTKLEILYHGMDAHHSTTTEEEERAESSTWAARRGVGQPPARMRRCIACREETAFVDVVRAPCRHEYCRSCLEDLFKASMTDESLFPPRCCQQPIVMSTARIFLEYSLVQEFEKKKIEFETPNRTYCYSAGCSAFIAPAHIAGDVATCLDCGRTTCTSCKARAHTGDCPNDTALQQLLTTAQTNGWQRCYACWRMVELDHGCNHMTCVCGAQFCYNCGQKWKACACEQWDEHRLLARAYQIIDRQIDPPLVADHPRPDDRLPQDADEPLDVIEESDEELEGIAVGEVQVPILEPPPDRPTLRELLVERTMQELRENHECNHSRWRFINGPHRCEECSHYLYRYIFECTQCRLQACNRCRRNRL
ncbi:hypothetical protein ASPZODRAFT_137305 [Penicilliopsis zonata CBS 506.65]|uniref:RBR-type E3 ubiquitin transferase n=1 Tax=Penicilliopsis zonata CBS 506.65 TaxID=1073090 RepID=A0A1L9S5E3_9EURO|nr:hypothetical protein ASPZODRAFT_137305 [Penicilliopsis zonata CBS 506.65]OJJ42378.1 hypothetical protein ASPZODRAFT_137305 [Penicilliopsis zonata CBS 506.65]